MAASNVRSFFMSTRAGQTVTRSGMLTNFLTYIYIHWYLIGTKHTYLIYINNSLVNSDIWISCSLSAEQINFSHYRYYILKVRVDAHLPRCCLQRVIIFVVNSSLSTFVNKLFIVSDLLISINIVYVKTVGYNIWHFMNSFNQNMPFWERVFVEFTWPALIKCNVNTHGCKQIMVGLGRYIRYKTSF